MSLLNSLGLPPEMALALGLALLGSLVLVIAAFAGGGEQKLFKRRLVRVKTDSARMGSGPRPDIDVRLKSTDSSIPILDQLIKQNLPRRDQLRKRLANAGLKVTIGNYLLICFVVALVGFTGAMLTGMVPTGASILIGFSCGLALPHLVVGFLARRRKRKFIEHFPEAIDLMTRGLKSGLPITESIKTAGEEVPNPVGSELRQVTDAVRLGGKLEDVLSEASENIGLQEFKFFTISLAIQSETGGNLTETLANLSEVLRKRRQLKLKIKALSSEAKASAYIIGSLPFIMAGIIYMINPGYVMKLIIDPRGHVLIGLGLFSFFTGAVVMFKMVRFDY